MEEPKESEASPAVKLAGWSIIACFMIAIFGVILAILSIFKDVDCSSSGMCLIAPAIAMGLLARGFVGR